MANAANELLIPTTFETLDDLVLYLAEVESRLTGNNEGLADEIATLIKDVQGLKQDVSILQNIGPTEGLTSQEIITLIKETINVDSVDDGLTINNQGNIFISIGTLQSLP